MSLPKQMLVATDFSSGARLATDAAIGLAARFGARLDWVTVVRSPSPMVTPSGAPVLAQYVDNVRQQAAEHLVAERAAALARGVEGDVHVLDGAEDRAIASIAGEIAADWVVLGTHGRSGLKTLLLGSVAAGTLRCSPCTTLTVREGRQLDRPGAIVVGEDFSEASAAAREQAIELALEFDQRIVLAHSLDPMDPWITASYPLPTPLLEEMRKSGQEAIDEAANEVASRGVDVETLVTNGAPARMLSQAALDHDAGWIVVGSVGRSRIERVLIGSIAEKVVGRAPCSVLAVKQRTEA